MNFTGVSYSIELQFAVGCLTFEEIAQTACGGVGN
jgi:hypothetical protein